MAVTVASFADTNSSGAVTSLAATMPAGVTSGDELFIVASAAGVNDPATATGWTQVASLPDGFDSTHLTVLRRTSDGSEGATVTVNQPSSTRMAVTVGRITGHHATTPLNGTPTTNSGTSGSTTAMTAPSVTTTAADCLILRCAETRSSASIAHPAGHTEVTDTGAGENFDIPRHSVATIAQASAGASGTAVFVSTGTNREWAAITWAIAPAEGGGGANRRRRVIMGAGE